MYESLTCFLDKLDRSSYGEWAKDLKGDGTPEHPYQMPFVVYDRTVYKLMNAIQAFVVEYREMGLTRYSEILKMSGIEWGMKSMSGADVSQLDGRTVVALLVGAMRAERFCDGAFLGFCEDGSIRRWLERLKVIDKRKLVLKPFYLLIRSKGISERKKSSENVLLRRRKSKERSFGRLCGQKRKRKRAD